MMAEKIETVRHSENKVVKMRVLPDRDIARKTEILRFEDFIGAGVVEDGFGVDTGLVGERTVAAKQKKINIENPGSDTECKLVYVRDGVHEGDVNLDSLSNQVLDFSEHGQVVLGLDVFWVGGIEAGNKTTKRSDTDTFANAKNGWKFYFSMLWRSRQGADMEYIHVSMWVAPASRAV